MSPYTKYISNNLTIASKEQKIIMIFNQVIKILTSAIKHVESNNYESKNKCLHEAGNVFYNLRKEINFEVGGELAKYLDMFFYATTKKIDDANMKIDVIDELKTVIDGISQVRDLFKSEAA